MGLILLLGDLALDNWTTQNEVSPKPKKRNAHEKHTSQRQMCRREKRFSRSSPTIWHREESPERANAKLRHIRRLPTHLAHPLKNERAIVIHALRPSLQGSRQNRGEPCSLFAVDIPSLGPVVVTTSGLRTINTRAPFDHVKVDL